MQEKDFRLLVSLYHTPNLTKAAELLYTTQPTLSRHIQQIEEELQTQLIIRTNKGIQFTPQGLFLVERGMRILDYIAETKTSIQRINTHETETVKIATANSYGKYTLPGILKKFQMIYPSVKFDAITTTSDKTYELVVTNEVDIGITRGDYSYFGEKTLLTRDECFIFSKGTIDIQDLPIKRFISYPLSATNQKLFDDWWFDHFEFPPNIAYRVGSLDICREYVWQDLGVGVALTRDFDRNMSLSHLPMLYKDGQPVTRST